MSFRYYSSLLVVGIILCVLQSCTGSKEYLNTPYFKNLADSSRMVIAQSPFKPLRIQKDDILSITIQTLDPLVSQQMSQSMVQLNQPALNAPLGQMGQNAANPTGGYLVGNNGEIVVPYVGKVNVLNLTTDGAAALISDKVSKLYKDVSVSVRFSNLKVTVLGEVNRPGTYILPNEKNTLFDALGQAGDLTINAKRDNLIFIRDSVGHAVMTRFGLNSTEMLSSNLYYLRQNDVIVVTPNKSKSKSANVDNVSLQYLGLGMSAVSLLAVIATLLKK